MAILGYLIDRHTVSRAGDAGTTAQHVQLSSIAHSLPATNPEAVFVGLRSVQDLGGAAQLPIPFGLGGNASLTTIGYNYHSAVSAPTIMFDVHALVWHTLIK